ncbi:MAG: periplasmic heavy metal sensor [Kiritimatiellae bacterium]|nr:periplasmic heavy metal sensor [Kiritimatiellia bacterium]
MKKWALGSAIAVGLAVAMVAWAGPGRKGGARGPGEGYGGPQGPGLSRSTLAEQAGLSDEESQALENLMYEHQKAMIPLRADQQLARLEVRRLLEQETPDEAAVMKAVEAASQAELALEKARISHQLSVRSTLGPEKAAQLRDCRREHRQERRGGRGGKGERREMGGCGPRHGPWGGYPGGCGEDGPDFDEPPPED